MKISIILLFLGIFSVSANSYSQEAHVTFTLKNVKINDVLDAIRAQTNYSFWYDLEDIDVDRVISVKAENESVRHVLEDIFEGENIDIQLIDNHIVLRAKNKEAYPLVEDTPGHKITGVVKDKQGDAIIGANIMIKGTNEGSTTDIEGKFSLNVNRGATLIISYIGYKTLEIPITTQDTLNIIMIEDMETLEEVVVVGYGTQKKGNLTGAISTIKTDEITNTPHSSLAQSLQGKIPGLQIRQQAGEPGQFNSMINIRGFGEPLYVIDGIVRDGSNEFQRLNANDIENISILKDASAAIYGLNAANGVVLVTTKKGVTGKPRFTYNGVFGWQKPTDVPAMANAAQYMEIRNDANVNAGLAPFISKEELGKWQQESPGYESTNWHDETMKKSAFQQQHDFSVRGGSDLINFFISFGYLSEDGLLKSNDLSYDKYTVRSNLTAKLSKYLTADVMISGRYDQRLAPGENFFQVFKGTRTTLPTDRPYANNNPAYPGNVMPTKMNPLVMGDKDYSGYAETKNKAFYSSASLTYDAPFLPGLKIKGNIAFDSNNTLGKDVHKSYKLYSYSANDDVYLPEVIGNPSTISNTNSDNNRLVLQAQIAYNQTFASSHNIGATLVYEQSKSWYRYSWLRRDYDFYTNDQIDQAGLNNQQTKGHETEAASRSYVGRFNYDFQGKYLLEYAFRYDGSYRYAPENRWGFFPVVSVGWRISEEKFIKNHIHFIDNLKLRGSYGLVGENAGDPFQYVLGFSTTGGGGYEFINGSYTNGAAAPAIINRNLTWFKSNIKNIGLDVGLFTGKFNMEFDLYQRDRKGLLAKRNLLLPNTFGGTLPDENLNSDRVKGLEFSLSHIHTINDFTYGIKANFNFARTMNVHVERAEFRSSMDKWKNGSSHRWNDVLWGYEQTGQFQNMEKVIHAPLQNGDLGNTRELPGDYIYRDVNGDGVINGQDQLPSFWGGQPKLYYGITLSAGWKGFDFSALLQGSGKYTVRFREIYSEVLAFNGNTPAYFHDRWHLADPYNPASEWIPGKWPASRFYYNVGAMYNESQVWRKDASYLRLKNVELGYTIPSKYLRKYWINSIRIYVNAYNLVTFADSFVKPFDPEKIEGDFSAGFTYPLTRSFNVGLNVSF